MFLVMLQALAAFGNRGNVARGDPPEAIIRLVHLLEPFGAVAKDAGMVGFVSEIAQGLDRLPNGHIDDDEGSSL